MNEVIAYNAETGTPITYRAAEDFTRDILDDAYPPLTIGDLIYGAGQCLERVDHIAFREAVLCEIDCRIKDGDWTEEPPATADEDDAETFVGLWQGGNGYSAGSWATDAEVFDSLDQARRVYEARARYAGHLAPVTWAVEWDDADGTARKGAALDPALTPCVDDTATLTLARLDGTTLDGLEGEGLFAADFVIHRDETGSTRVAEPIVFAG